MLYYLGMAIGPNDVYGELDPDYALDAERNDWELPYEELEWLDWWHRYTLPYPVGAVIYNAA